LHFDSLLTAILPAILSTEFVISAAAVVDPRDLTLVLPTHLDALRLGMSATIGLEVGKSLPASTFDALGLVATSLYAGNALLAAPAAFDSLRLCAAVTLSHGALTAATALNLGLALTAAALGTCLTLATTALCLGLRIAAALNLRMATMTALVRFCCRRGGNRHCCDTCCQDELPHHNLLIPSAEQRPC
jgi:hypothetical protein